jgi:hypothetical protein
MVAVAGNISRVTVSNVFGRGIMAEVIPDAAAFAILIPGTFTLIRGAGYAPEKLFRKTVHFYPPD